MCLQRSSDVGGDFNWDPNVYVLDHEATWYVYAVIWCMSHVIQFKQITVNGVTYWHLMDLYSALSLQSQHIKVP